MKPRETAPGQLDKEGSRAPWGGGAPMSTHEAVFCPNPEGPENPNLTIAIKRKKASV